MSEQKIPIPAMLYNAAVGGHVTNSQQIIDENENKEQSQINAEVKQTLGQGGSVDTRINQAKNDIIGGASSSGNTLKKIEDRVSPLESAVGTGGSVDSRISNAVAAETTRAQAVEEQLRTLYNNLQQSQPIPVTSLPATGEAGKIYRLAGTTSYSDYMYAEGALTTPIKMAEYNNAIDSKPITLSKNIATSGALKYFVDSEFAKYNRVYLAKVPNLCLGYPNPEHGRINRDVHYSTIQLKIDTVEFISFSEHNQTFPICFYDKNDTFLSGEWFRGIYINKTHIPNNAEYINIGFENGSEETQNYYIDLRGADISSSIKVTLNSNIVKGYYYKTSGISTNSNYGVFFHKYNGTGVKIDIKQNNIEKFTLLFLNSNFEVIQSTFIDWLYPQACSFTVNDIKNAFGDNFNSIQYVAVSFLLSDLEQYGFTFIELTEEYGNNFNLLTPTFGGTSVLDNIKGNSLVKGKRNLLSESPTEIIVSTQEDFNSIKQNIINSLNRGKSIHIKITGGTYFFNDNNSIQLTTSDVSGDVSNKFILITKYNDEDVTIMSDGGSFEIKDSISNTGTHWVVSLNDFDWTKDSIISGNKFNICNNFDYYQKACYADGLIEVVDSSTKYYRLKMNSDMSSISHSHDECVNMCIWLDTWYKGNLLGVDKIENGYVYFYCSYCEAGYGHPDGISLNNSYYFGGKYARYNIYNLPEALTNDSILVYNGNLYVPNSINKVQRCSYTSFIKNSSVNLGGLYINGLNFVGSGMPTTFDVRTDDMHHLQLSIANANYLIAIENINNVSIINNKFYSIGGMGVIYDKCQQDSLYYNNEFIDTFLYDVTTSTNGAEICNNKIKGMIIPNNQSSICTMGQNTFVHDNVIIDAPGIKSGCSRGGYNPSGIIENNLIYFTEDWHYNYDKYCMMDTGCIYTAPINDLTIIRDNVVYNYKGLSNNSLIFCDDGAKNVKVYRNILISINNYSFNLYLNNNSGAGEYHNTGNLFVNNIVSNHYKIEAKPDTNDSYVGENIFVRSKYAGPYENFQNNRNIISNIPSSNIKDDIYRFDICFSIENGLVGSQTLCNIPWGLLTRKYLR